MASQLLPSRLIRQRTNPTAFTFTLPSITRGMGYRSSEAQLLTIPPYFLGAVAAYLGGRFADRARRRYPFIVGPLCIVIVSMCIVIPLAPRITRYVGPGYFAICLAHLGFYPLGPCINTWTTNSLAGPAKRAMGMAFMLAMGNSGSIIGSCESTSFLLAKSYSILHGRKQTDRFKISSCRAKRQVTLPATASRWAFLSWESRRPPSSC